MILPVVNPSIAFNCSFDRVAELAYDVDIYKPLKYMGFRIGAIYVTIPRSFIIPI